MYEKRDLLSLKVLSIAKHVKSSIDKFRLSIEEVNLI